MVLCSDTDDIHYTDENTPWRKTPQMIVILLRKEEEMRVGGVKMLVVCSDTDESTQ